MPNTPTTRSIGRYQLLSKLGEGGMAVVYKAFDPNLHREVAIKVIQPGRDQSENFLHRFKREALALAQLGHPNIIQVLDYGEFRGAPYLVMEYAPGGTLKDRITGPIPYAEAARLLAPVARALAHAHQRNIIHRDVKPANILFTQYGEPKLTDFGIAKLLDTEETTELTSTGSTIGTPAYMAPEQGTGGSIDKRVDVYALGVVFYELVTGRKPYNADTPMALMIKKATEPLERPSKLVPGLPEGVEAVLVRALSRDPSRRFQSMDEFAAALETIGAGGQIKGPVVIADTDVTIEEPRKQTNPMVWIAGVGVALLGICLVSAIVFGILYFKNNNPTPTASPGTTGGGTTYATNTPRPQPTQETSSSATNTPRTVVGNDPIVIAYVIGSTYENEDADIYVANENGTGSHCAACEYSCSETEPSVSPDGEWIVYQSMCNGHSDLYLVSVNGYTSYALTNTANLAEREPAFSPDGSRIAYRVSPIDEDRNNNGTLYVMNADGSNAYSLGVQGRGPAWSPDNDEIAYMSNESGTWQIYVYNLDNRHSSQITHSDTNCRWPVWSPDGAYIAYNTTPSAGSLSPDSIWYIRADGSGSAVQVATASGGAGRPSWSSNGLIAFNTTSGIEVATMNGGSRKVLIPGDNSYWAAAWSR